jgi:hypothetical protein
MLWIFLFGLSQVFGPNSDRDRRLLLDDLAGILRWWNMPWYIGNDINVTCFPSERSCGARLVSAMRELSDFVSDQGLMHLPLVGCSFTWSISHDHP